MTFFMSTFALQQSVMHEILYDMPVSNHGARLRMIIKAKGIDEKIRIQSPTDVGGLKSPEYIALNPLGKMPAFITSSNDCIPESDTIARYILEKYPNSPTFISSNIDVKYLSEKLCRFHDIYISSIQGCMYRAPGSVFGAFGTDRVTALNELKKLLIMIENEINKFETNHEQELGKLGPFLCGSEVSLCDVTLYPTMIFCMFMLPQFFGWQKEEFLGPRLSNWYDFMTTSVPFAKAVHDEMMVPLNSWKESGRFTPIVAEMEALKK